MRSLVIGIMSFGGIMLAGGVSAQTSVGVGAGLISAKLVGDKIEDEIPGSRTGVTLSAWVSIPLARGLVVMPGLRYMQKGGRESEERVGREVHVDYIQIPLLVSLTVVGSTEGRSLDLFMGPAVAVEANCEFAVESQLEGCGGAAAAGRKTLDISGLIGLRGRLAVSEDLYIVGSASVDEGFRAVSTDDSTTARNRAFIATIGLEWAVAR